MYENYDIKTNFMYENYDIKTNWKLTNGINGRNPINFMNYYYRTKFTPCHTFYPSLSFASNCNYLC